MASAVGRQNEPIDEVVLDDEIVLSDARPRPSDATVTVRPSTETVPEMPLTCLRRNDSDTFRNSTTPVFRFASYCRKVMPREVRAETAQCNSGEMSHRFVL